MVFNVVVGCCWSCQNFRHYVLERFQSDGGLVSMLCHCCQRIYKRCVCCFFVLYYFAFFERSLFLLLASENQKAGTWRFQKAVNNEKIAKAGGNQPKKNRVSTQHVNFVSMSLRNSYVPSCRLLNCTFPSPCYEGDCTVKRVKIKLGDLAWTSDATTFEEVYGRL